MLAEDSHHTQFTPTTQNCLPCLPTLPILSTLSSTERTGQPLTPKLPWAAPPTSLAEDAHPALLAAALKGLGAVAVLAARQHLALPACLSGPSQAAAALAGTFAVAPRRMAVGAADRCQQTKKALWAGLGRGATPRAAFLSFLFYLRSEQKRPSQPSSQLHSKLLLQ